MDECRKDATAGFLTALQVDECVREAMAASLRAQRLNANTAALIEKSAVDPSAETTS